MASTVLERLERKPFAIIGHRGAAGLAPENTLEALRVAIEAGADIAEFDVQVTRDGTPVASHDSVVVADNGVKIDIRRSSASDLEKVSVRGARIPTIEELLAEAVGKIPLFLEIKYPEDTPRLLKVVKDQGAEEWVAIISFYDEALLTARKTAPEIPCGRIYYQPPGRIFDAKKLGCQIVLPRYSLATGKAVGLAHRLRLKVVAWTVNDEKWLRELWRRGVDGIATDYPDRAAKARKALQ